MSQIGIRNFVLIVRIENLVESSNNHYEIIKPNDSDIIKIIGTLAIIKKIINYNLYVLGHNNRLIPVQANYKPFPNQIVILINKSVPNNNMTPNFVLNYLNKSVNKYVQNSSRDINLDNIEIDPVSNLSQ